MKDVEELKSNLAKNLVLFRKKSKLTQMEVGEKINYSDKAISKWERGENMPELSTLFELAKLYKCSLQELTGEKPLVYEKGLEEKKSLTAYQRISITLMSILGLWFLSIMSYMFLSSFVSTDFKLWLIFIYTIPLTFIVTLIFNCVWGKQYYLPWVISLIVWGLALSIFLTFNYSNKWLLFVIVAILQLIAIIWYSLLLHNKRYKSKQINNLS